MLGGGRLRIALPLAAGRRRHPPLRPPLPRLPLPMMADAADPHADTGFPRDPEDPRRRLSPACGRNKQPILEVLQAHLPPAADGAIDVLEIASGTGEHCAHFVAGLPHVRSWQPTEYTGCASPLMEPQNLDDIFESILGFTETLPSVKPPVHLDAAEKVWGAVGEPGVSFDAIVGCNVTHISPTAVTEGIIAAAARLLRPGTSPLPRPPSPLRRRQTLDLRTSLTTLLGLRCRGRERPPVHLRPLRPARPGPHRGQRQVRRNPQGPWPRLVPA